MTIERPSLGARLLRHVLAPLALTWFVGTIVALGIAHFFTEKAFDRALLDDAFLLASHVKIEGMQLQLTLTPREVTSVLFDQVETMAFSVTTAEGELVAGHAGLKLAPADAELPHRFEDMAFQGRRMRAVTVHREKPVPFDVVVAETTVGRTSLLQRLALFSLLPQALLLTLLAWWLSRSIRREVLPLADLREAVEHRDANDLTPVIVEATTSDVARLADSVNSLLMRLETSVRNQREFAGNVAHELRTPLAGIRALAEYGLARDDPHVWRTQLQGIASSEARASRLVDKLLDLALAHEAETSLKLGPVALDEMVRDAVMRFLPRADAADVDLGALGLDRRWMIHGDPTLVEGILNNLLDNALRYGVATDGTPPAITVAIERVADSTRVSVLDNGPGLPGEVQADLMTRGTQGETGQLLGQGAGLGLALVAQYAKLMKASVTLGRGNDGHGWVTAVTFPPMPEQPARRRKSGRGIRKARVQTT